MRSSGLQFAATLAVLALTACGGAGDPPSSPEAGQGDSGSNGDPGPTLDAGNAGNAGTSPAGGGSAGFTSIAGASGSGVAGTQGSAGSGHSGGESGYSGGGASSVAGAASGGSADSGAGAGAAWPPAGCDGDYASAGAQGTNLQCHTPDGMSISFSYSCSGMAPANCTLYPGMDPLAAVKVFCCQQNDLGCTVVPNSACAKKNMGRQYLYSNCGTPGNPDPMECTATNALNNEFCCSGPYLK